MKKKSNLTFGILKLLLLCLIFYLFGVITSRAIDKLFSPCDFSKDDSRIIIEIILEFISAFIIFSLFKNYIIKTYNKVLCSMTLIISPELHESLITISFSYGVFKYLEGINENTRYITHKYF